MKLLVHYVQKQSDTSNTPLIYSTCLTHPLLVISFLYSLLSIPLHTQNTSTIFFLLLVQPGCELGWLNPCDMKSPPSRLPLLPSLTIQYFPHITFNHTLSCHLLYFNLQSSPINAPYHVCLILTARCSITDDVQDYFLAGGVDFLKSSCHHEVARPAVSPGFQPLC